MQDGFTTNVTEVVNLGDTIKAHILTIDPNGGRVALSMRTAPPPSTSNDPSGDSGAGSGPAPRRHLRFGQSSSLARGTGTDSTLSDRTWTLVDTK